MTKIVDENVNQRSFTEFEVKQCVWHRNGISGKGFFALHILWPENGQIREAFATVDGEDIEAFYNSKHVDPATRVLMVRDNGSLDLDETMRGDFFHEALVKWIHENHG